MARRRRIDGTTLVLGVVALLATASAAAAVRPRTGTPNIDPWPQLADWRSIDDGVAHQWMTQAAEHIGAEVTPARIAQAWVQAYGQRPSESPEWVADMAGEAYRGWMYDLENWPRVEEYRNEELRELLGAHVGLNADWSVTAYHLGGGIANRTPGAYYVLESEDEDVDDGRWEVVRRWYLGDGTAQARAQAMGQEFHGHDVIEPVVAFTDFDALRGYIEKFKRERVATGQIDREIARGPA